MTHDEMIAVIQADKNGETIESFIKHEEGSTWRDVRKIRWNFENADYRVKSKPFECWINIHPQYTSIYTTERAAMDSVSSGAIRTAVHMKEVV